MKKLKRVFGSVANLSSGRNDEQTSDIPRSSTLSNTRRSISGSLHESSSPQRGSYYSYETQSLDSLNSNISGGITPVDPHSKQDKKFTKLHKWAYLGDITKLKKFIKKVPIDSQDSEGKTALHHAAAQGHGDAVLFLLGSKSNVDMRDNLGMTPFLKAVERAQLHIVQMLLQRHVEMKVTDYQSNNCLHFAARTGATDLLMLLLDCGIDCDVPNSLGRTPLHIACAECQQEAAEAILRHGGSVNVSDKEDVTPLMVSAKMGSVALVETLIDHGADVSPLDASKWSAADYARFTNHNQLYSRLKTLMHEDENPSLIPQGLLNVSDDGSNQDKGAIGLTSKNKHSNGDGSDDSWSDNSDVMSIKERPKLNLTKFLPSSDESTNNLFGTTLETSHNVIGPPKPPRLHTSTSSLASESVDAKGDDEYIEKEGDSKADNSWKSSLEEEPKLKSFSLFSGQEDSPQEKDTEKKNLNDGARGESCSRTRKEDFLAELGLNDIEYQSSEEDISFDDEEKPVLPLEETPKKIIFSEISLSPKYGKSVAEASVSNISWNSSPSHSVQNSFSDDKETESSIKQMKTESEKNENDPLVFSPQNSEKSIGKFHVFKESPKKSPSKRSPRKTKPLLRRSSIFDSDSDSDELNASKQPARRKSLSSIKRKLDLVSADTHAIDQSYFDYEKEGTKSKVLSKEDPETLIIINKNISDPLVSSEVKQRLEGEKVEDSIVQVKTRESVNIHDMVSQFDSGSCTDTLSTVVGTLGREGTMQEMEEVWEANASLNPKNVHISGNRNQNSESSLENDVKNCNDESRKNNHDIMMDITNNGKAFNGSEIRRQSIDISVGKENKFMKSGRKNKDEMDNTSGGFHTEDTAHDVSDDDLGANGMEDFSNLKPNFVLVSKSTLVTLSGVPHSSEVRTDEAKLDIMSERSPLSLEESLSSAKSKRSFISIKESPEKNGTAKQNAETKELIAGQNLMKNKMPHKKSEHNLSKFSPRVRSKSVLGGLDFSDEDSSTQDPVATQFGLDELDDGISAASTETEESTHINSGLKESLLTPLSSLPDASDVGQLQDLVRELRLKLEKEFGRRVTLETRVSHLQQEAKQAKHIIIQQEADLQYQQQEISTLVARIRKLEYQGRCEQDSSRLKDQSLDDCHQRCTQLEEQCTSLRTHAQQQEQLVDSLMIQLQTKEQINQSLQGKLEELSSQTKYVSMKSCQTEDIHFSTVPSGTVHVQTDIIFSLRKECETQTDLLPAVADIMHQTDLTPVVVNVMCQTESNTQDSQGELKESGILQLHKPTIINKNEIVTISTQTEEVGNAGSKSLPVVDMAVESEETYMLHAYSKGIQCNPEKLGKSTQTHIYTQTCYVQTSDDFYVQENIASDSFCQTAASRRHVAVQTDPVSFNYDLEPDRAVQGKYVQVQMITSALEPIMHNLSHDVKSLIMEEVEMSQSSALEMINRTIASQIDKLESIFKSFIQQTSTLQGDKTHQHLSEEIQHLQDILQGHMSTVSKIHGSSIGTASSDLQEAIAEVNSGIHLQLESMKKELTDHHNQEFSEQQVLANITSAFKDLKENGEKILKHMTDNFQENKDSNSEGFNDLKQHLFTQITEVKKAVRLSSQSDDSGVSESLTRGIGDKIDALEKSLSLSLEKSCTIDEISGVQREIQKMSDVIQKKIYLLEQYLQSLNTDTRLDQAIIDEHMNTIKESNKQFIVLLKNRTSGTNYNISEALEENFQIIQDHIHRIQQTLLQRINEVSEHVSIAEDQKLSWLSKQVTEMATQVSGIKSCLLRVQSSIEAAQSVPSSSGIIDDALVSSLKASNEQTVSTLKFQNQSIIQQLEMLQKEIQSIMVQGQSEEKREVLLLKEALSDKENELTRLTDTKGVLQDKLQLQSISLESLHHKEEEQHIKIESLQEKLYLLEVKLKEKDQKFHLETMKNADQSKDSAKVHQENFRLSSENAKLLTMLQAEQQQHHWYEEELRGLRDAKDVAEAKVQEMISRLQQSSLQRLPPTGRDNDEDRKQEIRKLELEKHEAENSYTEQCNRLQQLELHLKKVEAALGIEKSNKEDLEQQLRKTNESLTRLQQDLSEARHSQDTVQDLKDQKKELEIEIKSKEVATEALRKKLETVSKEKLDLKQEIMLLKGEKLSFELIKQEKELAEQMQKKTEEQLHQLQKRIPLEYISKSSFQLLQKEWEGRYQLEINSKLAELNHIIEEKSKQQESLAKTKESHEQELKNELSRKSNEIIHLRAKLSVRDEEEDTWKVRHDRLMALYQHQNHSNHKHLLKRSYTKNPHGDSLSMSLQEIDNHLKTPFATSTLLEQLTPPSSLQLMKTPNNIDSYHYTHSDSLDHTLRKYLSTIDKPRSPIDDKPQAKISPLQSSTHSFHHDGLPDLDQSCEDYVDLLKQKYGL